MSTTRHPAYTADALITSTEAARILRSNPHDPLAFRRLDQLRSTRKLVPIDVDDAHGPRFLRSDVEALARPWEHAEEVTPATNVWKTVLVAALVGIIAWAGLLAVALLVREAVR